MNAVLLTGLAILFIVVIQLGLKVLQNITRLKSHQKALKGVKSRPCHWFWGHLSGKGPSEEMLLKAEKEIKHYPKATVRWLGPVMGRLQIYFPSLMQVILNTEEPKDSFVYGLLKPWIGDGLLVSSGSKWKRNRRLLTGAFHFDMLRGYLKIFNETASAMVGKWEKKGGVEAFEDVSLMTLDAMLQCSMSSKTNCQNLGTVHPYIKAVLDMSDIISKRFFKPLLAIDFIFYNFTSLGRQFKNAVEIAHEHSQSVINDRKNKLNIGGKMDTLMFKTQNKSRFDFLDTLLLAKDEKGKGLTDREIRDEVDTFLFEGHDTTASGISWALYNLARHPEIQERCRQEINQVLGDRNLIAWEDLNKFEYLTMCIKESLRLNPPVFSISRRLTTPLKFEKGFENDSTNKNPNNGISKTFPTDLSISLRLDLLHRNPNIWENPEVFDPERFTSEKIAKRSPYAFLPFSAGSRNCIGQNFAMMEMKVALALCLKKFKISLDETFPRPERIPLIVLRAKHGIHLKLSKTTHMIS